MSAKAAIFDQFLWLGHLHVPSAQLGQKLIALIIFASRVLQAHMALLTLRRVQYGAPPAQLGFGPQLALQNALSVVQDNMPIII
jgi:hypothetical protein